MRRDNDVWQSSRGRAGRQSIPARAVTGLEALELPLRNLTTTAPMRSLAVTLHFLAGSLLSDMVSFSFP